MSAYSLTIYGQCFSKANSRKIVSFGKRAASIKSDKARAYEKSAIEQINRFIEEQGIEALEGDLLVKMAIYYPDRRQDLDESLVLDVLQKRIDRKTGLVTCKGIYLNDRQVKGKEIYWGIDKDNPRQEILIEKL